MSKFSQTILTFAILLGMALSALAYFAKASDLDKLTNILIEQAQRKDLERLEDQISAYEQVELLRDFDSEEKRNLRELKTDMCIKAGELKLKRKVCE